MAEPREQTQRERILNKNDLNITPLHVPQWDETIKVRGMNAFERAEFIDLAQGATDGKFPVKKLYELAFKCAMDEQGQPLFKPADRDMVFQKNGAALEYIALAVLRNSGVDKAASEEMRKNLGMTGENGGSTTS